MNTPANPVPQPSPIPWYKRIWCAIWGAAAAVAKAVYEIVAPAVRSAALQFVNDPQNQAAAVAAVRAAMQRGLKGDAAWKVARDALLDQLGESAWSIADNWLDTLLQSAYFAVKNAVED